MRSLLIVSLLHAGFSYAQLRLPRLVSDGMVLQRDAKVKIWGWAEPAEKIALRFASKQYSTIAGTDGKWQIELPSHKAGGPYEMMLSASNTIQLKNILFGDVWLCSGQSNMELGMDRLQDKYPEVIASANNPEIRQFLVPDKYNFNAPNEDVESGEWLSVNRDNIFRFSGVGYFFATELYAKYKVPIGLINSALGGAPAEAWISEEQIKKFPDYYAELQKFKSKELIDQIESNDRNAGRDWFMQLNSTDPGVRERWSKADLDDQNWAEVNLPAYFDMPDFVNTNGSVWFRKEIIVPKSMIGKPCRLWLGRIVDSDSAFVNGAFVGTTSYQYPPRKYMVKENLLKEGKNVIAVRVISSGGKGAFIPDKPYFLFSGKDSVDLKGKWKYKVGAKLKPMSGSTTVRWKPSGLYNAMIAPLTNFAIKGALWYQGEANTRKPLEYTELMRTLITDWRTRWNEGDFPFIVVELANFMNEKREPSESGWAQLRQAQLDTRHLSNTAVTVSIDVGEWNDIHPLNKKEVGRRLALQAMRIAYNDKKIISSGPIAESVKRSGNQLIVEFSNTGSGLVAGDGKALKYFAIAGKDRKFVWAKAEIKKNTVIVSSENVSDPVTVRYAWADNPSGANLCNKEKLPASPFEISIAVLK
ncbi:9-O-acetylesterase [Cytophagales bacterium WSM2-2]|nr:9-O-acetylesterase [Cytophagales bacterium WSM2-2]